MILSRKNLEGLAFAEPITHESHLHLDDIAQHYHVDLERYYPIGLYGHIVRGTNGDLNQYISLVLMLVEKHHYKAITNQELDSSNDNLKYYDFTILDKGDLNDLASILKDFSFILTERYDQVPLNVIFKSSGINLNDIPHASYDASRIFTTK